MTLVPLGPSNKCQSSRLGGVTEEKLAFEVLRQNLTSASGEEWLMSRGEGHASPREHRGGYASPPADDQARTRVAKGRANEVSPLRAAGCSSGLSMQRPALDPEQSGASANTMPERKT